MLATKHRFLLSLLLMLFGEIGILGVLLNGRPDPPIGFRLWFGMMGVLFLLMPVWVYRQTRKRG